jgi:integrase
MAAVIPLHQYPKWAKRENVPPMRQPNQASRAREHLTPEEVERMIVAARHAGGRLAERDVLLIMMAYRHGLRASELIALRWDQMDLKTGTLHVTRLKHGSPATHVLRGPELRALRTWKREQGDARPYVFTSLRGGP